MKVKVDEKKFAFIMCTNNKQYCREALHYIKIDGTGWIYRGNVRDRGCSMHDRGIPAGNDVVPGKV